MYGSRPFLESYCLIVLDLRVTLKIRVSKLLRFLRIIVTFQLSCKQYVQRSLFQEEKEYGLIGNERGRYNETDETTNFYNKNAFDYSEEKMVTFIRALSNIFYECTDRYQITSSRLDNSHNAP